MCDTNLDNKVRCTCFLCGANYIWNLIVSLTPGGAVSKFFGCGSDARSMKELHAADDPLLVSFASRRRLTPGLAFLIPCCTQQNVAT